MVSSEKNSSRLVLYCYCKVVYWHRNTSQWQIRFSVRITQRKFFPVLFMFTNVLCFSNCFINYMNCISSYCEAVDWFIFKFISVLNFAFWRPILKIRFKYYSGIFLICSVWVARYAIFWIHSKLTLPHCLFVFFSFNL